MGTAELMGTPMFPHNSEFPCPGDGAGTSGSELQVFRRGLCGDIGAFGNALEFKAFADMNQLFATS